MSVDGLILPADAQDRIADRVKRGDPVVGWKGDPTMDVLLDESTGLVEVWAFDPAGNGRYVAASVDASANPGWRHQLLCKLRDGAPERGGVKAWFEAQQKAADARERAEFSDLEARAERLAWGVRRAFGHEIGLTRGKEFY
jgi:hypothetical protein